jgi:hypothetical protein
MVFLYEAERGTHISGGLGRDEFFFFEKSNVGWVWGPYTN